MTSLLAWVAGVSLLVGGIGIMNIMLVSVSERTREIGIRKALGASNSDISAQFLIESLAISIGGGVSGYIAGYVLAFIISTFLTFDPILSWQIAVIAIAVSMVMGTVFGLYPAFRASRKDPIDSLREYS
jgi:ABC-type antimicrobial peptide transport system permease subunit